MKNIHVLPTNNPSRLQLQMNGNFHIENGQCIALRSYQNIYITSDEEIKEGDSVILKSGRLTKAKTQYGILGFNSIDGVAFLYFKDSDKKIILTTDQDLIKDGVKAIDDGFLEWFVNNSSCEEVEVVQETPIKKWLKIKDETYCKIIIQKEQTKKESLEYGILQNIKMCLECNNESKAIKLLEKYGFQKQEERYSDEEVMKINNWYLDVFLNDCLGLNGEEAEKKVEHLSGKGLTKEVLNYWFEQFKKK